MIYEQIFKCLNNAKVKYLVAGGMAVNLHGIPRVTQDLDILVDLSPDNIKNLAEALKGIGFFPRVPVNPLLIADPNVRNEWITKKNMKVFCFYNGKMPMYEIDVFLIIPVDIKKAFKKAVIKNAGDIPIPLVSIDDLIEMKKQAGRPQDLWDIEMLKALQKMN